jgi:hypothetical protein
MFQLRIRILETILCVFLVVALVESPAAAKCISLRIDLNGDIVGSTKDLKVVVEIASASAGDSDTEARQDSSIEGSRFRVLAWFDTTSNIISTETCDRNPHLVTVKLMQGEQVLDRQTLSVERDFRRTKSRGYKLQRPITLHRPVDK